MEHALDLRGDMGYPRNAEFLHQLSNRIAEHLVPAVHQEGRRPTCDVVEKSVHPLVVWFHTVKIRIHRNVPGEHVERGVLGYRILAERRG